MDNKDIRGSKTFLEKLMPYVTYLGKRLLRVTGFMKNASNFALEKGWNTFFKDGVFFRGEHILMHKCFFIDSLNSSPDRVSCGKSGDA